MPTYFNNQKILNTWFVFFKTILDAPIPEELKAQTSDFLQIIERDKNVHWRAKKWNGKILQRIIQKYGNKKLEDSENSGFAEYFQKKYSYILITKFFILEIFLIFK